MRAIRAAFIVVATTGLSSAAVSRTADAQVVSAVLNILAKEAGSDGSTVCVMPTLRRPLEAASTTKNRNLWSYWSTSAGKPIGLSESRRLDLALKFAKKFADRSNKNGRITKVPLPLILSKKDAPEEGRCAMDGKGDVYQIAISKPALSGDFAFVETYSIVHGTNPPPELFAFQKISGRWMRKAAARRTLWFD